MRISDLARTTGVPVATVKFYLRERLLREGVRTSATQAQYDESHVARLRLVRALLGPGGLTIAQAQGVLRAIDDPPEAVHDLLGAAVDAVSRPATARNHDDVHALMEHWGWQIDEKDCDTHDALADALDALEAADFALPEGAIDMYADHMSQIAAEELAGVPTESAGAAVRYVVLGTVLIEPLILTLRRLAQQEMSARRFGRPSRDAGADPSSRLVP